MADLQRTVYTHKWSPVRSNAGEGSSLGKDQRSVTVPRNQGDKVGDYCHDMAFTITLQQIDGEAQFTINKAGKLIAMWNLIFENWH